MRHVAKVIPGLVALLFLVMGLNCVLDPMAGAEQMAIAPLGPDGLNTIRGDLGGLFLGSALLLVVGIWREQGTWLVAVAVVMLLIAAGRLVGFLADGAPGQETLTAFGFEVVIAVGLIYASRRLESASLVTTS